MVVRIYPTYSYKTKPYTNDTGDENSPFPVTQEVVTKTVTEKVNELGLTVVDTVVPPSVNAVSSSGVKDYVDGIIVTDFATLSNETVPSTSAVHTLVTASSSAPGGVVLATTIPYTPNGNAVTTSTAVVDYINNKTVGAVDSSNSFVTSNGIKTYVDSKTSGSSIVTTSTLPVSIQNLSDVPTASAVQNYVTTQINNIPGGNGITSTTDIEGSTNQNTEVPTALAVINYINNEKLSVITAPGGTKITTDKAVVDYIESKKSSNVTDNNTNFSTSKSILNYVSSITSENVADNTEGNSTKFPTVQAVKSYVNASSGSNVTKTTVIDPSGNGNHVPTQSAVINYLAGKTTSNVNSNDSHLTTSQAVVSYINELTSSNVQSGDATDFPTNQAVKTYVDALKTYVDTEDDALETLMNSEFLRKNTIQNNVDSTSNVVTSSGIKAYVDNMSYLNVRNDVISGSSALVTSNAIYDYVETRVSGLSSGSGTVTVATTVQNGNNQPVSSNAVYDYIHDTLIKNMNTISSSVVPSTSAVKTWVDGLINNELSGLSSGSSNLVSASGIFKFVADSFSTYDAHAESLFVHASGVTDQITASGSHLVTSSGIFSYISGQSIGSGSGVTVTQVVENGNNNAVSSNAVHTFLTNNYIAKNDVLNVVSSGSANTVTSSGVYNFVKQETANYVEVNDIIHVMASGSSSLLTASGIYNYVESKTSNSNGSGALLSSGIDDIISLLPTNTLTTVDGNYLFNGRTHDPTKKLGMNIGKYKFSVPGGHPIYFRTLNQFGSALYNGNIDTTNIKFHGTTVTGPSAVTPGSNTVDQGVEVPHYVSEVTIEVLGPFQPFSYVCHTHGYMGGQDRLIFSDKCTPPIDTSDVVYLSKMLTTMYNDETYPGYLVGSSSGSNLPITGSGLYEYMNEELSNAIPAVINSYIENFIVNGDTGTHLVTASGIHDFVTNSYIDELSPATSGSGKPITASGVYKYFKENVTDSITTNGFSVSLPPTVPVATYSNTTLTLDGSGKSYLYGTFTPNTNEITNIIVQNSIVGTQFVIQLSGSGVLSSGMINDDLTPNPDIMMPKTMNGPVSFEEGGGIISIFHAPNGKYYLSYVEY